MANQNINNMTALWNVGGTSYSAIKMNVTNAGSLADSKLLDLQIGAVPKFTADKDGDVVAAGTITSAGVITSGTSSPAINDGAALGTSAASWSDLFLASGGVVNWAAGDVTITHTSNLLAFAGATSGYTFDAVVIPTVNDGAALGTGTVSWSDLCLATGGVINWGNGNSALTHSAAALTVTTGDLLVATAGTTTNSVVTVGATQTLTGKTLTSPTLDSPAVVSPTITGAPTAGASTWTNLGAVTTCQINGGSIDGTAIGQNTPSAIKATNLQSEAGVFTGALTADSVTAPTANHYTSVYGGIVNSGAVFQSLTTSVTLAPVAGNNTIYLQPRGYANIAGRVSIDYTGAINTPGSITSTGTQTINSGNLTMTGTANYLSMTDTTDGKTRSVHHNSSLIGFVGSGGNWALNVNDAGDTSIIGQLNVDSIIQSTDAAMYLCSTVNGTIALRPNGAGSSTEQVTINSAGTMTLNPSTGQAILANRPTTNGRYTIQSYGFTDAGAVLGYAYGNAVYGILGYYDVLTGADASWSFYGNGNARTSGTWQTSDQRLKSEIADCDCGDAYDKVRRIGVKSYRKQQAVRGRDYDEMGFLAQDIEKVIPEAVMDAGIPKSETEERERLGDTVKLTNDHTLLAHLWAAVQHQAHIIDGLNLKIEALGGNR